jgi:hypothetical protein
LLAKTRFPQHRHRRSQHMGASCKHDGSRCTRRGGIVRRSLHPRHRIQ